MSPGNVTPRRSASPSSKRPTPRGKKPFKVRRESINTESLSSYVPSDPENLMVSLSSSGGGGYSDDFQENSEAGSSIEQLPKLLPATKLGYTIT